MVRQTRIATEADIKPLVDYYINDQRFSPKEIFDHLQRTAVKNVNFNTAIMIGEDLTYLPQYIADLVYYGRQPSTDILSSYVNLVEQLKDCSNIRQVRKLLADFQPTQG